jgi:hypothetical protein
MRPWDALSRAMARSRVRRIGSREAERLLAADSHASAYPNLNRLLAAAAAPPRPDELTNLRPAVAAFEAAGFEAERHDATPSFAPARARRMFARSITLKAVAGVAVALFGGTALAAETGHLPGRSQQHAHDLFAVLGVPSPSARASSAAPTAGPTATPTAPPSVAPTTITAIPTTRPSSSGRPATPGLSGSAAVGLCRSWVARQNNPKHQPIKSEASRRLAAAAGGEEHIAAFCATVLAEGRAPTASQSPSTTAPTPSHPGNGKGHGKPTTKPHKKGQGD